MNRLKQVILWVLPALVLAGSAAVAAPVAVKVVSVVDGDTLTIDRGAGKERVILYGIDCPELTQDFGQDARRFTDERAYKKTVSIEEKGRDKSGRTIATIYLGDGQNLNQQLVEQGLAWWSDKYAAGDAQLKALQAAAKQARRGLWARSDAVPPWIWRNGQKNVQATIKGQ